MHCSYHNMIERLKSLESPRALIVLSLALICCIMLGHFATDMVDVALHNVYRRLYYLPILIGCFAYGLRGGSVMALFVTLAYIPHAFFSTHHDPAPTVDKVLEIVLYFVVGLLTGWLVDRERLIKVRLERALVERRSMEVQLIRAGKLSAMGEMIAGVAHEIRNPLASIKGSAEVLADDYREGHRKYRMSQVLLLEIDRLARLVSKFLLFAQSSEARRVSIDLNEVIKQVVEIVSVDPETCPIVISGMSTIVLADPDQIQQVVLNLVLNGVRANKKVKNPPIEISCGQKKFHQETRPYVSVRDRGVGVPPELLARIFDPFFTTEEAGTGLGLSISHTIMDAHSGYIEVESLELGTVFWVVFEASNET